MKRKKKLARHNKEMVRKTRPKKYRRSYKFPEIIKDDNPNIVSVKYHHA